MSPAAAIDENLRMAMRFFGEATGTGSIVRLPGVLALYSGLDYGVFNIAMLEGHEELPLRAADFEQSLRKTADFFSGYSKRWSLWLWEDLLEPAEMREARRLMSQRNLRNISSPPGMICRTLEPPRRELPAIELRHVSDGPTRKAFAELTALAFEIPYMITQIVYEPERAWRGAYQGWVAYRNEEAVASVATVTAAGVLGIYSLATHPARRRRGFGEAILRAAVEHAQPPGESLPLVLQSTDAGYALYRRLGFRDAARFSVYLTQ